jgi:hypothetical protein
MALKLWLSAGAFVALTTHLVFATYAKWVLTLFSIANQGGQVISLF